MFTRERIILSVVIAVVLGLAVYIWSQAPRLEIEYPETAAILTPEDYAIQSDSGDIVVGESRFDQVVQIYPDGKTLGLSTIYQPASLKMNLTFSEDENILIYAHIEGPHIVTARGIQVGDSYEQVFNAYGENYTRIQNTNQTTDYDLVYGSEDKHNLVFQVRNNTVVKIIIHNEP